MISKLQSNKIRYLDAAKAWWKNIYIKKIINNILVHGHMFFCLSEIPTSVSCNQAIFQRNCVSKILYTETSGT